MKKQALPIFIFSLMVAVFVIFVLNFIYMSPYDTVHSINGYYDISDCSDKNLAYALEGNWNYQHYIPSTKNADLPAAISHNTGETIYTCHVKVQAANTYYCLFIPRICSDYKIVINGETIYKNGVYDNKTSFINYANTYSFYSDSDEIDIELHTTALPALPYKAFPILIGPPAATNVLFIEELSVDTILFIIMIVSGIYYAIIASLNKAERSYKAFSAICFIMALRCSINNFVFLGLQFPQIPNAFVEFTIPIITPLLIIAILIYTNTLYEKCFNKIAFTINVILSAIYILLAPFFNYKYPFAFLIFYIVINVYTTLLIIITGIKLSKNKIANASSFVISSVIMLIAIVMESTLNMYDYKFGHAMNIGFVFYVLLQTNTFLIKLKSTYTKEKELTGSYTKILEAAKQEQSNFIASHLKPHFIFNSLNAIGGYALFAPEKAKKICSSLEMYNRQMFEHNNLKETNTLDNEIELAEAFGYIESERFPNITITYDIEDGLGDTIVPSLLIQPLLENAINHGIRKRSAKIPGHINISVHNINNFVNIEIKDDGVGMDEETVKRIKLPPSDNSYHSIFHLSLRLGELYYEELHIESAPNEGTTVSFKIPRNKHTTD